MLVNWWEIDVRNIDEGRFSNDFPQMIYKSDI